MSELITRSDQGSMVRSMNAYLPGGELYQAANIPGTEFNALMNGLSGQLLNLENFLFLYNSEFIPDTTDVFIEEWESAVGIPDDCFPNTGTNAQRRLNILVKLASLGVQTADDFEALATIYGFPNTIVEAGVGSEDDIIINGNFATDTDWEYGQDWTISGGTANKAAGNPPSPFTDQFPRAFNNVIGQQVDEGDWPIDGNIFVVTYDIVNHVAGSITALIGGASGTSRSADGTYVESIVGGSVDNFLKFIPTDDFEGSIDNVMLNPSGVDGLDARFTIIVTYVDVNENEFPLTFPISFGVDLLDILSCLFTKLKPANCNIIFVYQNTA